VEDSMQPACREEAEKARKWKRASSLRAAGAERKHAERGGYVHCVQGRGRKSTQMEEGMQPACSWSLKEARR